MVSDLSDKYEFVRMSKDEIISVLGEPAVVDGLRGGHAIKLTDFLNPKYVPNDSTSLLIIYDQGNKVMYEIGMGVDSTTFLYFELDENDMTISVYIVYSMT